MGLLEQKYYVCVEIAKMLEMLQYFFFVEATRFLILLSSHSIT
jgi:hypothetical protein